MRNLMKMGLLVLALGVGACSSSSSKSTGNGGAGGGSGGSGGGSGGASGGSGGSNSDGGDAGNAPASIADCVTAGGGAQAVNDCIINLPTTSVGQAVTFTPSADYTQCHM